MSSSKNLEEIKFLKEIYYNYIDICILKTFVWAQYLHNDKQINFDPYYSKDEFYLDVDSAVKAIKLHKFEINTDGEDEFRITMTYDDKYYFVYKIIDTIQLSKDLENITNNYTVNKTQTNWFVFPDVILFLEKLKDPERLNVYSHVRRNITPKVLFKAELEIKKMFLITSEKYHSIISSVYSKYTQGIINKHNILYNDISFLFFSHPEYFPLDKIYGFKYIYNNNVTLLAVEYRFSVPDKKRS